MNESPPEKYLNEPEEIDNGDKMPKNKPVIRITKYQRKVIIILFGIMFFLYAITQNNIILGVIVFIILYLIADNL